MQLIGMLDSPYVRRVAVSLQLLGIPFEHRSISVFRQKAEFEAINPLVKAPTLVTDDGTVLMDSSLILDHLPLVTGAPLARPLMPADPVAARQCLRVLGLALAACEKTVQIVYEMQLRPPEHRHGPGWTGSASRPSGPSRCWRPR
jgi:glutathione S-transferase